MKRISPAMVMALVALFVSLAGNAAAVTALVTSRQIQDKTIELRDISPAARASLRGNQGPQGPQGLPGAPGLRGLAGARGPAGKSFDAFQIENDLEKLCKGIRDSQKEIDGINTVAGRYPAYWSADFRYGGCFYYY